MRIKIEAPDIDKALTYADKHPKQARIVMYFVGFLSSLAVVGYFAEKYVLIIKALK